MVIDNEECPMISWMIFGSTPDSNILVAKLCLNVWQEMGGNFKDSGEDVRL